MLAVCSFLLICYKLSESENLGLSYRVDAARRGLKKATVEMKAISKYIFRQLVITTLIVTVSLTVIVSLFGSLRLIDFIFK